MKRNNNRLTEGSVLTSLVHLSLPIIFANVLQTAYQLTDTFWVGRLGAGAVAAVSISFPIIFFMIALGGGLSMAGSILVAQFHGRENREMTDHVAAQTFLILFFVSLLLAVAGYFLAPFFVSFMVPAGNVYDDALSYMRISLLGIVFLFGYAVFQSVMRGVGDVKTPVYLVLGTVLLNLILDPLFIFGFGPLPAMGVAGAAVATVVNQGIAAVLGIRLLSGEGFGIRLRAGNFRPDFSLIRRMFRLGIPASVEQSALALGMIVMTFLVSRFGTVSIAAYGIGTRILSFVIIPALGLSMATSTLVGQNIGAGKADRAERIVLVSGIAGFLVLAGLGVGMFFAARIMSHFFVPGEPVTEATSALFIRIMAPAFGFIALQQVINGAFRGSGNTLVSMLLSILALWILRFPLAYLLSHHTSLGEAGIWYSFPAGNVIASIVGVLWFSKGTWKTKRLTEEIRGSGGPSEDAILEEGIIEEAIIEEGIQ